MRRSVRNFLLISGASIVAVCLIAGGLRLFKLHLRARVETVIQSAELVDGDLPATIPFRYVNRWMIVKGRINESAHEYDFIVDTGAEATCLLRSAYESLGLTPISVGGISIGNSSESVVLLDSLCLPGLTYARVGAVSVHEDTVEPVSCLVDGGIIGINVLSRAPLQIDYDAHVLIVGDGQRHAADSTFSAEIPFVRDDHRGLALLDLTVGNHDTIPLLLDTGFSGLIKLPVADFPSILEEISTSTTRRCWSGPPIGSHKAERPFPRERWVVRMNQSSVGSIELDDLPITLARAIDGETRGLLGNHFLEQYHVTINWAHYHCRLGPKPDRKLPCDIDVLGLTYRPYQRKLIVDTVYERSQAMEAGITPGDEIIAIGGRKIADLSPADLCLLWPGEHELISPDADSLLVTIRHGTKHQTHMLSKFSVFGEAAPQ